MNDLLKNVTNTTNNAANAQSNSGSQNANKLFIKAMAQVYHSNSIFRDRLGVNLFKEMLDDIIRK